MLNIAPRLLMDKVNAPLTSGDFRLPRLSGCKDELFTSFLTQENSAIIVDSGVFLHIPGEKVDEANYLLN